MDSMRDKIISYLKKIVLKDIEINVTVPENEEFGHYSTNVAFQLAERSGKKTISVAEDIVSQLRQEVPEEFFKKIEVAPPGFINFWIHDKALLSHLNHLLKKPNQWGKSDVGRGKTVRVEYFQPNVAKIPHVGHLRSAVIGDALKRMFIAEGYTVVSDTHIGDWGTQFGILIYGYKSLSEQEKDEVKQNPIEKLNQLYINENRLIEDNPERRERAKEEFAKLECGDKENREIWQWMRDVSMEKFREIINRLNLLSFEEHRSESAYGDLMPEIVELSLRKKAAKKTDDGAVVVDLLDYGLGEAVLIKSDGASTYLLRDLATLKYWQRELDFWKNLYVVDVRQSHHFKQLFKVAELLGLKGTNESEHIEFGFMSLPEGAMSTRKGSVISLLSVLDDVIARAREVIQEKNPNLENANEVAKEVGIGALKYFDLSHHRKSNIIFNREEALSFEGDTGPYIQYTNARFLSILRRIGKVSNRISESEILDDAERLLLIALLRFPEVIESALEKRTPNTLTCYLHELAQKANEFYHSHPVMQEENTGKKAFRVALARALSITFTGGLSLLGISAPRKM